MTARAVLEEALARGVGLQAVGGKLRWRCRGPLPDDLRTRLAAVKTELLGLLAQPAEADLSADPVIRKAQSLGLLAQPAEADLADLAIPVTSAGPERPSPP